VQLDANLVHALELDVPHVIALTSSGDVTMTVTLFDARHCPGSAMFLFDGYFGRILYTGDFRYEHGMLDQGPLSQLKSDRLDVLYIDNTFCSPKGVLPSRREAENQITSIIERHPDKRVVFGLHGLGKEDVLISLAERFDVRITVSETRYRLLEVLGLQERFVVASQSSRRTRFEAVELVDVTRSSVDAWNRLEPMVVVLLTGLFVGLGYQPFAGSTDIFVVPLSDHSSYAELRQFVAQIRPKSVVPIVRTDPSSVDDPLAASLTDRTNMECFAELLDRSPMHNYHIPTSVLEMMNRDGCARNSRRGRQRSVAAVSTSGQMTLSSSAVTAMSSSSHSASASPSYSSCRPLCNSNVAVTSETNSRLIPPASHHRRHLHSCRLVKQRQNSSVNFPALFELRRKGFSVMNEMIRNEWNPVSTCSHYCHATRSMAEQMGVKRTEDVSTSEQGSYSEIEESTTPSDTCSDNDIADIDVANPVGLPDLVEFGCTTANHTRDSVLQGNESEREIGAHHSVPKGTGEAVRTPTTTLVCYTDDKPRFDASSLLHPKKKWRKQFRAAQLNRSHQENRQLNVDPTPKLIVRRPESWKSCRDEQTLSLVSSHPEYLICTVARRLPLLTNHSAVDIITSRSAACTPCCLFTKTTPRVSDAVRDRDCAQRRLVLGARRKLTYPMSVSSTGEQHRSAVVTTLPLDLSVYRASKECNAGVEQRTFYDVALH